MLENNLLTNGRFWHNLNSWVSVGAVYSAGDGDGHYGTAVLSTGGDSIAQTFSVANLREYTVNISVKPAGSALTSGQLTAAITDGDGNAVVTLNPTGAAGAWNSQTFAVGLVPSTTYTITIRNASAAGNVSIDDVWLWFVPVSRQVLAQITHRKLGRVSIELGFTSEAAGLLTEGAYTDAVDEALRSYGAINDETGRPDIRYLDEDAVKAIVDLTTQAMLERGAIDYGVEVDITLGPHTEKLSQKQSALAELAGISGGPGGQSGGSSGAGNRQVLTRDLSHDRQDYRWSSSRSSS